MDMINRFGVTLLAMIALGAGNAYAQEAADDQAAVWAAVEAIWMAEARADNDGIDAMLTEDFMGWNNNAPTPRSKVSSRMWRRFSQEQEKAMQHELFPLSIVVRGDTAVAHYLYSNAVQKKNKEVVVSNGRFTDILVRDGASWKFIAWHGGDDPLK